MVRVQRGGENVFDDLAFDPVESANLRLRSDLMVALRKRLDGFRVTQVEAARLLAVSQPRISDLMRGKIDRFSIDMLVLMLGRAGVAVRLAFSST
jgi:predicted XRE-type DNA-binding protein